MSTARITEMLGMTMLSVEDRGSDLLFTAACGRSFRMWHDKDCCETVELIDTCGDLEDLVGSPLVISEEAGSGDTSGIEPSDDSSTWTFYKFSTAKGHVTLRWFGESNGWYSERPAFSEVTPGCDDDD